MKGSYTTPEVADILGETLHKVTSSYVRQFKMLPEVQKANGHGTKNLWSGDDIVVFATIQALKQFGITTDCIRAFLRGHPNIARQSNFWIERGPLRLYVNMEKIRRRAQP